MAHIMKVKGFKLINGEEIIARFTVGDGGSYVLEKPRVLGFQETQQGMGLGFMPYIIGNPDADVVISKTSIIAEYEPRPEIEKAYMQQTSKIQLA